MPLLLVRTAAIGKERKSAKSISVDNDVTEDSSLGVKPDPLSISYVEEAMVPFRFKRSVTLIEYSTSDVVVRLLASTLVPQGALFGGSPDKLHVNSPEPGDDVT